MVNQLEIRNLTNIYKTGDGIQNINLTVKKGELMILLGPSGCGKTTVLRSVGGFVQPQQGQIIVENQDISHLPPEKRPTAMVFQSYNLWPHMKIFDNLAFSMKLRKKNKKEVRERVQWALNLIRLEDIAHKYPSELSGGQQQRVALARALLLEPKVLLLDEPFSALDAKLRYELREELRDIQSKHHLTMLFVTHDQEEALSISDRIVVMNKGKIEQMGTPKEIYDEPKTLFVSKFIGKMNFIGVKVTDSVATLGNAIFELKDHELQSATAAIRPEDIVLLKEKEHADFEGVITKIMILGHYVEMTIDTPFGALKSIVEKQMLNTLQEQDQVFISLKDVKFYDQYKLTESVKRGELQRCLTL